jgi:hypothetical protein
MDMKCRGAVPLRIVGAASRRELLKLDFTTESRIDCLLVVEGAIAPTIYRLRSSGLKPLPHAS